MTCTVSSALLAANRGDWVLPPALYDIATNNTASVQIFIQVVSNALSLCQITVLCTLINRATRLYFRRTGASINVLQFWFYLCSPTVSWNLPLRFLLPLLLFVGLTVIPSGLWADSLSPISSLISHPSNVMIPAYANASWIKEYPSEFGSGPQVNEVRNSKGIFSYRVGNTMEGALLSAASAATTVDGSPRKHSKLDDSGFTYIGRSYGVGAAVGLTDSHILDDNLTTTYSYQETGYNPEVRCIYNSSADFTLESDGGTDGTNIIWQATGRLPNSLFDELSMYFGRNNGPSIVAVGVAAAQTNGTKYMGIAAGSNYAFLNATQCSIDYMPTLFNITIDVKSKTVTVLAESAGEDMDPDGNITHVCTRQLELISNDQTNLYQSLVGNSLISSIGNYNISQANSSTPVTEATATLAGLTNSVSAMLDDILVGYASAQLMIENQSTAAEATVTTRAPKVGQKVYIHAMFSLNVMLLLLVLEEAIRTRLWKDLGKWDYRDIRAWIATSVKITGDASENFGGETMADDNSGRGWKWVNRSQTSIEKISGRTLVRLDRSTESVVLNDSNILK